MRFQKQHVRLERPLVKANMVRGEVCGVALMRHLADFRAFAFRVLSSALRPEHSMHA